MFLHAKDAAEKGNRRIMLRTVDTDVVVLAVSTVVSMENTQLWIAFGTGKHLRYRSSFSRVLGMEQESDARTGTDVDVTPRSGRVLP